MDNTHEQIRKHETGAVRSTDADGARFDLISPIGLRRLAARYKMGSDKYGDHNWKKGFKTSDVMNHVLTHLNKYLSGDRTDDNLAAAVWGLVTIMHFEETRSDMDDLPGGPSYSGADKDTLTTNSTT